MIKLGIIGYPLGHTLSPVMHKATLDYLGIEGEYTAFETPPDELVNRIKYLRVQGFRGFNVTIPHKVWITPFLKDVDDLANLAGAVNTVLIDDDKEMYGYNTDIYGFVNAIPLDFQKKLKGQKVGIFGAGGASRAIIVGLASLEVKEITIFARNIERANDFKNQIKAKFSDIVFNIAKSGNFLDLSEYSMIVNTTPLGMQGEYQNESPVSQTTIETLPSDALIYDLVYKPRKTKFLEYAENANLTTIEGLDMLVLQGAKAFEIWTGQAAPVDAMKEAVLKSL